MRSVIDRNVVVRRARTHTHIVDDTYVGLDSSVGVATRYGLDGPWIESRWEGRFFPLIQTSPGTHPTLCTTRTESLSRG